MLKKVALLLGVVALLAGCQSTETPMLNLSFTPSIGNQTIGQGTAISLDSQDLRSAQYIVVVDDGKEQVTPLHARQNLRVTLEEALTRQLVSHGYIVSEKSRGKMRIDILELVLNVKHSALKHDMNAKTHMQIVVESPTGKFVKRYSGRSSASGLTSASTADMESMVNNLVDSVLNEISIDQELNNYILENL